MEEPAVFVKDSDYKVIDAKVSISHIEEIPKIRKRAEALADKLMAKVNELSTHEFDEEIKELQSILDELQHFGIVISFSTHQSKKNP